MKIVIAAHSFQPHLTAPQACAAIQRGFAQILPHAHYTQIPMADGGEGTTMALVSACGGEWVQVRVSDPLGRTVLAKYGVLPDGTAVMELSEAAGWHLLTPAERNPMKTSSYGVGEMIADALNRGVHRILLGTGAAASYDGGAGMAQALGFRLRDKAGRELPRGGAALRYLTTIDASGSFNALDQCQIIAACDLPTNAPTQSKNTRLPIMRELDTALNNFADVLTRQTGIDVRDEVNHGVAGGLGLGLRALLGAEWRTGIDMVLTTTSLTHQIAAADLVITGEGHMDGHHAINRVPYHVLSTAKAHDVPVIALAGSIAETDQLYDLGFAAILPSLETTTPDHLATTARAAAAIWAL